MFFRPISKVIWIIIGNILCSLLASQIYGEVCRLTPDHSFTFSLVPKTNGFIWGLVLLVILLLALLMFYQDEKRLVDAGAISYDDMKSYSRKRNMGAYAKKCGDLINGAQTTEELNELDEFLK